MAHMMHIAAAALSKVLVVILKSEELVLFIRNVQRVFMHSSQKVIDQSKLNELHYLEVGASEFLFVQLDKLFNCDRLIQF